MEEVAGAELGVCGESLRSGEFVGNVEICCGPSFGEFVDASAEGIAGLSHTWCVCHVGGVFDNGSVGC